MYNIKIGADMNTEESKDIQSLLTGFFEKGDEDAFNLFCQKYYVVFYNYVLIDVRDRFAAEDVVQDLFKNLLHLKEKDSKTCIESWAAYLFRAAKNISINYAKKKQKESEYILIKKQKSRDTMFYEEDRLIAAAAAEDDGYFRKEDLSDLIAGFSRREKKIFQLRYFFDFGIEAITKKLKVSRRTVNREIKSIKRKVERNLRRRNGIFLTALLLLVFHIIINV